MKRLFFLFFSTAVLNACTPVLQQAPKDDGQIRINFIQVNDVYEIAPLNGGTEGGMARLATLKKKYLEQNPNTFLVMAGDFLSPSVYNSLKYGGKPVRGRQMVETMNAAGMDLAIFGNHEFDIKEQELQERINESRFQWISSNTFHQQQNKLLPFVRNATDSFPVTFIKTVTDADGTTARIGFIALTLPFNKAAYVGYAPVLNTAKEMYNRLRDTVDAVVAITHQAMEDDKILAREIPGLAIIMGGHEHDQHFVKVGNVTITKAMANAKSAFVNTLIINKKNKRVKLRTKLELIDDSLMPDQATDSVVQKWVAIAEKNYDSLGFNAGKVVISEGMPLDGRESSVRSQSTNLTRLITGAMTFAAPNADAVILNAGSIRVDDMLQIPVTQYDILRTLPFGGGIREVNMYGSLLIKVLDAGVKNKGTGGFLHVNESLKYDNSTGTWKIKDNSIDPVKIYRVALSDFLLTGGEANLEFLKPGKTGIVKVFDAETNVQSPQYDIRKAVIQYAAGK